MLGYVDGNAGAALERAVDHHGLGSAGDRLAAFVYGWCRGYAEIRGYRPLYYVAERWLSKQTRSTEQR